MSDVTIY